MEHLDQSLNAGLNVLVVVSLGGLMVVLSLITGPLMALMEQAKRTLYAAEQLTDTVNREVGPTLQEVDRVLVGVREIKQIAEKQIGAVGGKVEDVSGSLNKAAGTVKKSSIVWGHGLLAGLKSYLDSKPEHNPIRHTVGEGRSNEES